MLFLIWPRHNSFNRRRSAAASDRKVSHGDLHLNRLLGGIAEFFRKGIVEGESFERVKIVISGHIGTAWKYSYEFVRTLNFLRARTF